MKYLICIIGMFVLASTSLAQTSTYHALDGGEYRLTIPESYTEDTPTPLMIALHSTSSSPHAMAVMTGFDEYAEEMGMIVAYPKSDGDIWNEGDPRFGTDRDDVAFINSIVEELSADYNIDSEHVMLSGFGSGGLMAFRIACESPETFDTIAVAGAMLWGYHLNNCPRESAPVNMIIFRGSEDIVYLEETYNIRGLFEQTGQPLLGVDDTLEHWTKRFNCSTEPQSTVNTRIYQDCDDGVQVAYVELTGARQNWLRDRDDWTLNQFGVDVSELILDFAFNKEIALSDESLVEDVQARTYSVYIPTSYDETTETPIVFVLHGRFGSGAGTASHIGINPLAEAEGFIGVYPDGLLNPNSNTPRDTGWNYIRDLPYYPGASTHDDTQFFADIVDDLAQDLNIDRDRIYVTGLSNGGFMVQRLACEAPDQYAGFASVAGAGFGGMELVCGDDTPVNMLVMHGTLDNNIQWNGNPQRLPNGELFYTSMPITQLMDFWAAKLACTSSEREDIATPETADGLGLVTFSATGCESSAELILYAVLNGGHNWPGIDGGIPNEVAGLVNLDVDATQIIWDFFASHSLADFD